MSRILPEELKFGAIATGRRADWQGLQALWVMWRRFRNVKVLRRNVSRFGTGPWG
jgi:hypothetical protein